MLGRPTAFESGSRFFFEARPTVSPTVRRTDPDRPASVPSDMARRLGHIQRHIGDRPISTLAVSVNTASFYQERERLSNVQRIIVRSRDVQ